MTGRLAFERARRALLEHRDDLERARAEVRWPQPSELASFNWAWDWFEEVARREMSSRPALILVSEQRGVSRATFAELAERSTRVARWLRDHGVERGDRILVMLGNVMPLWETMLAAIKLGAVVIPATTQLTEGDVDDRIVRGKVRHMIADRDGAPKLRDPQRLGVRLAVGGAEGFIGGAGFRTRGRPARWRAAQSQLAEDRRGGTTALPGG